MRILVLNSGSSSLKFKLYNMNDQECLCSGVIEKISKEESPVSVRIQEHIHKKVLHVKDHGEALNVLFDLLFEWGLIVTVDELRAVGHRVVHGGELYAKATMIDERVLENLRELIPLAPLHNPANIAGIEAVRLRSKELIQVAVFDTAFHQRMPAYAYRYALPNELYEQERVRRYGFHGTSHGYVLKAVAKLLNKVPEETNAISLHLGNGASVCAIEKGRSVDTSMGMTPLEGLVMGSRSGDLDPGIIFFLHRQKGYSIDQIDTLLNARSGLLGLCGENDMRIIVQRSVDDEQCRLALDIFVYRIKKYIGAYLAVLGKVDALVFTAGIGEHSSLVREMVCNGLESLGIEIDKSANLSKNEGAFSLHAKDSKIKIFVIATDEELEIALQTKDVLLGI